ncbi:carbohydrate ABC transporter permease [Lawsonibacter sp. LCP25S3_G6]|uniref:carbohydrate ABC transporter permease n=1 Tax=unclassified Lawsonibacter TaxID=2617946 RepID=UPI003F9AB52C
MCPGTVLVRDDFLLYKNSVCPGEKGGALSVMTLHQKKRAKEIAIFFVKTIVGVLFISPLIIGVCFSLQTDQELMTYPLKLITTNPTFESYLQVFREIPILHYLKNSAVVCLVCIFAQIIISCLAAYGFVFFKFPGKNLLFTLILITTMIPGEVVVITNYVTIQNMKLVDTYLGLVLPSLISGTAIFLMRQYFMTLPKDYKEAAVLDGCGDMGFLFRIAVPLSIPTIFSLAIYLFVQIYNQYFWPMLVTSEDEMRTIQIGISYLVTADVVNYGHILAGAVIAIVPSVLIYIFGQDYIIKGMTSGGLKG